MILYISKNSDLFSYQNGVIYKNDEEVCTILLSWSKRLLSHFRLLNRLLRLEPRCATFMDDNTMILAFQHQVLVVSVSEKKIKEFVPLRPNFSNPLNFCSMKRYGQREVYWGDYGENMDGSEINIYKYTKNGLEVCYSFPKNSIKHVHNIIYDKWRDRFIMLTGDLGDKVGIYTATRDFKRVEPFMIGDEKYRAVQGLVTEDGLIWATDAVMSDNFLYYCSFEEKVVSTLASLNGSVIYGMVVNSGLLFSTTVEPYPTGDSRLKAVFYNRLGPGIKSRYVDLCYCSGEREMTVLKRFKKDWLPLCLFQYGQIMFPEYEKEELKEVVVNPMSVKKFDGKTIKVTL